MDDGRLNSSDQPEQRRGATEDVHDADAHEEILLNRPMRPPAFRRLIASTLPSGSRSASTASPPRSAPILRAVAALSPVSMTIFAIRSP